jgi:hypothetical protein
VRHELSLLGWQLLLQVPDQQQQVRPKQLEISLLLRCLYTTCEAAAAAAAACVVKKPQHVLPALF